MGHAHIIPDMSDRPCLSIPLLAEAASLRLSPSMSIGDADTTCLLGLLTEAQRLLRHDPARAHHCIALACGLLQREAQTPAPAPAPCLIPERPKTHRPSPIGGLANWQVRKVTAYIDSRLGRNLSGEELALVASLSPGHFCRAFKVSIGETPHAYVIRQRIRRAQALMLDTRQSLSDIACACGLTDQAHLTRLFKRLVGTTPLLWRRRWQVSGEKA